MQQLAPSPFLTLSLSATLPNKSVFFLSVPQQSELVGDSSSFLKSYSYMDFSPKFPDHNHNVMYEELLIFTSQLS